MNKIIFLKNVEQLQYVKSHNPNLLHTHKSITNSVLVYSELRNSGYCVESASKYLKGKGLKYLQDKARELSIEWYKPFEHLLDYRDINLGELARIDNIFFFREVLASTCVIHAILNNNKINEIVVFSDINVPCIWNSRYSDSNNIFEAVVLYNAESRHIHVKKLFLNKQQKLYSSSRYLKNKVDKLIDLIYVKSRPFLKTIGKHDPRRVQFKSFQREVEKKLILGFGVSYDLLILWPALKALFDTGEFQQILINGGTTLEIPSNRAGLYMDNKFQFIALEDFFVSCNNEKNKAKINLNKLRQDFKNISFDWTPLVEPLKNPYLNVQFDFLWNDYFPNAISIIDAFSNLLEKMKPDLVLVDDMMSYPQRILVKLARIYGIKSVSIPHGWVGDIDEYEFESDLYLAWGELSKKQLIDEFGKNPNDINVVGAAQFNKIALEFSSNIKNSTEDIKEKFALRTDVPIVMFLTCNFLQTAFNNLQFKDFFSTWEAIKSYVLTHPNVEFIIKPHPADNCTWYKEFLASANLSNLKLIEGVRLEELLPAVDIGVSVGAVGTSGYLVLLAQKPLFFLNSISFHNNPTTKAWGEDNGITVVTDEEKLAPLLDKTLYDESFKNKCIKSGQVFLERSLNMIDGKVEERIVQAINSLFEKENSNP